MANSSHMVCLGGGHGLYQTLLAARSIPAGKISAIVTVADDGGSSGRLRRELNIIPPGDLRMALSALSTEKGEEGLIASALQHRFGGNGALAGHAVGNLLIAGLTEVVGDMQVALDKIAELCHARGRVIPVVDSPLDIEAEVAGLDDDPMVMCSVRGQVAVATTPGNVHRVRVIPDSPHANPEALKALRAADIITIGPGSWFTSVIPHLLVPEIVAEVSQSEAMRVVALNLSAEPGETQGFSAERHIHMLFQHAPQLKVDFIIIDSNGQFTKSEKLHLQRAADILSARVVFADVLSAEKDEPGKPLHDPKKLGQVISKLYTETV